ncbi:hypothetical protein JTI58_12330 [Lysinibacillus fusiformis]|uniref:hypothetical protein n=1 Tax=Lysinibacillus fusiformis TaxID=28031 RepID=UPI001967F43B|nr:hypothetical protein [Lysinibacillus fusiformis]QSB07850.1 hypothetical protein JTI58_12330 [Lysinibacillus fusiformis]
MKTTEEQTGTIQAHFHKIRRNITVLQKKGDFKEASLDRLGKFMLVIDSIPFNENKPVPLAPNDVKLIKDKVEDRSEAFRKELYRLVSGTRKKVLPFSPKDIKRLTEHANLIKLIPCSIRMIADILDFEIQVSDELELNVQKLIKMLEDYNPRKYIAQEVNKMSTNDLISIQTHDDIAEQLHSSTPDEIRRYFNFQAVYNHFNMMNIIKGDSSAIAFTYNDEGFEVDMCLYFIKQPFSNGDVMQIGLLDYNSSREEYELVFLEKPLLTTEVSMYIQDLLNEKAIEYIYPDEVEKLNGLLNAL